MDQALLDKDYTKEEWKALPDELRLEITGYLWACNKLVAYKEMREDGRGFNMKFAYIDKSADKTNEENKEQVVKADKEPSLGSNMQSNFVSSKNNRLGLGFDIEMAEMFAKPNLEVRDLNCSNPHEMAVIIEHAKNYRIEEKPAKKGLRGWLFREFSI